MVHDPIDVVVMLRVAGWKSREQRTLALAIFWAESHLDDQAIYENMVNGAVDSVDRGLAQLNSKWQSQVTDECAFDPVCNLAEAYKIYVGRSNTFSAWSAFKNGTYKAHMEAASVAVEAEIRLRRLGVEMTQALTNLQESDMQEIKTLNQTIADLDVKVSALELDKSVLVAQMETVRYNVEALFERLRVEVFKGYNPPGT